MKIAIGITGASGTIYARRLAQRLLATSELTALGLVITDAGMGVGEYELGKDEFNTWLTDLDSDPRVVRWANSDLYVPIASGSASWDALVIVPCSMGTLARVAHGVSGDLISRAADVMIKERRRAIFCPREAPLSLIHLRNMVTLTEAGGTIIPLSPSFYGHPQNIDELCDTIANRILAQIGLPTPKGWKEL